MRERTISISCLCVYGSNVMRVRPWRQHNNKRHTHQNPDDKRQTVRLHVLDHDTVREWFRCKELNTHEPALDAVHHDALGQIHGVGDGEHDELGLRSRRPVEDVVHHRLLARPQQVQLQRA